MPDEDQHRTWHAPRYIFVGMMFLVLVAIVVGVIIVAVSDLLSAVETHGLATVGLWAGQLVGAIVACYLTGRLVELGIERWSA